MWIVRLALRRPYTFVVMAVLIAILGGAAIVTMPVDIFPYIDIPIVSVVWHYTGLSPEEMEKRVVTNFERSLTSNVNDIEHIESQSYNGIAVIRFTSIPTSRSTWRWRKSPRKCRVAIRNMPPGMLPGNVLKYDAASVPILQLGTIQQDPTRAGNLRPGPKFHPHSARHRARRVGFLSLRRQKRAP